jgi:hypothetical protein
LKVRQKTLPQIKKPNKRTEDDLQTACVRYYRYQFPNNIIVSFPAGFVFGGDAAKRAMTANRMKAMGYENGFPDILIVTPAGVLFIEMKAPGGYLSPVQKAVHKKLESLGFHVSVCRSIDEFMQAVEQHRK